MTLEEATKLVDQLNEAGIEATVREGYSGRGMYGKETVAIQLPRYTLRAAHAECPSLARRRCDQLGMSHVVY